MTDDIPTPKDSAFERDNSDAYLRFGYSLDRIQQTVRQTLWPVILVERFFLLLAKPIMYAIRGFLPYGYYLVESTVHVGVYLGTILAVLAGLFVITDVLVGVPVVMSQGVQTGLTRIMTTLHYIERTPTALALALTTYYALFGVIPYRPHDKYQKDYRRRKVIKPPFKWEKLVAVLIPSIPVAVTFALAYFLPGLVSLIPGGVLGLAVGTLVLALVPHRASRRMFVEQWDVDDEDEGYPLELDTVTWLSSAHLYVIGGGLFVTASGVPADLLGISLMESLFYTNFVVMAYVARTLRWTQYEDRDGLINIRPHIRLWGTVSRLPLAYVAVIVVAGGFAGATSIGFPVFCVFAPLAAALGYLVFRFVRTNQNMYFAVKRVGDYRDDYDIAEDLRRNSPLFNHEQSQALRPKNQMWAALSRATWRLRELNNEVAAQGLPTISPFTIGKLTYKTDTSHDRRARRIRRAKSELRRVKRAVAEENEREVEDLQEVIDDVEEALEKASDLNSEVGKQMTGRLNEVLFK